MGFSAVLPGAKALKSAVERALEYSMRHIVQGDTFR